MAVLFPLYLIIVTILTLAAAIIVGFLIGAFACIIIIGKTHACAGTEALTCILVAGLIFSPFIGMFLIIVEWYWLERHLLTWYLD